MGRQILNTEDALRYAEYVCPLVEKGGGGGGGGLPLLDKGEVMGSSINFKEQKKRN